MPGSALCEVCAERLPQHLAEIAELWEELEGRIAQSDASGVGQEKVNGNAATIGISLNDAVVQLRQDVMEWTYFLARALIDERDATPPKDQSTPSLLTWIAQWHSGWLIGHEDAAFIAGITDEARTHQKDVRRRAFPSGARKVDLPNVRCSVAVEVVDDAWVDARGQEHERTHREPCAGHMFAIVSERAIDGSDLICTEDESHRVPSANWRRQAVAQARQEAMAIGAIAIQVWLSPQIAAQRLRVSVSTVYVIAKRENWDKRTFGREVQYSDRDVLKSLEKRESAGQPA